jgi:multidrug resistance efflux pump
MTNAEFDKIFAKSDAALALLIEAQTRTDAQLAQTDAQLAKTDAQLARTDAKLEKLAAMVGGMSANQGDMAEEFFYNSLLKSPIIGGVEYERVQAKTLAGRKGKRKEFDIVLVNGSNVALIEVKFKAHLADVEQAERQVQQYRDIFPEHARYTIYSGIAALSVPEDVVKAAHSKGLFVLKQVGDAIEVDGQAMRAL